MKNIILFSIIGLLFIIRNGTCSDPEINSQRFHIGLNGGCAQKNTFAGDVYFGIISFEPDMQIELNIGYTYFRNSTHFYDISGLFFNSHGLFAEGNYYFTPVIYAGINMAVNYNHIDLKSQSMFDGNSNVYSPTLFTGECLLGQIGINFPVGEVSRFKIQAQVGFHDYKIAEKWIFFGSTDSDFFVGDDPLIEDHLQLFYKISIGILFLSDKN